MRHLFFGNRCTPMRLICSFLLLFFCSIWGGTSTASADNSLRRLISENQLHALATDPTWLDLLHFEPANHKSTVLNPDFFLANDGRQNPLAELEAIIAAYNQPWEKDRNNDPRCRFPARYYWLSQKIPIPDLTAKQMECQQLQRWPLLDTVQSVSVMMVSGYLGNPASTFGHALIKFNTDEENPGANLFDLTLNYGALIPPGENPFVYAAKGLFGGYEAVFSDRYYYNRDLVYSHTEFREMWEYRLALSDYEKRLLLYHIWEITRKKFKYYFLKENCAYKVAELLDVVITEDVLQGQDFWYAPVDLFYRLIIIDEARKARAGQLLLDIKYLPSSQRKLHAQLQLLSPDERDVLKRVVEKGYSNLEEQMVGHNDQSKVNILDALLGYHQYQVVASGDSTSPEVKKRQQALLNSRFKLPAEDSRENLIPEILPPTRRSPPIKIGVGLRFEDRIGAYGLLSWSPYSSEIVSSSSHEGDELVLLNLAVGAPKNDKYEKSIFIDKLDILKIVHLNTLSHQIDGRYPWSWKLRFGADRLYEEDEASLDFTANFGAGYAQKLGSGITLYAMLAISSHTESTNLRATPQIGFLLKKGNMKTFGHFGLETKEYSGQTTDEWEVVSQYNINSNYSIRIGAKKQKTTNYTFEIKRYF